MSDLGDFFGKVPGRPDVPEFWQLSEILLMNDGAMAEAGDDPEAFVKYVERQIPVEVLMYVGQQRAMRAVALFCPDLPAARAMMSNAASWQDGFIAGMFYAQRYQKEPKS